MSAKSYKIGISVKETGRRDDPVSYDIQSDIKGEITEKDFLLFIKKTILTIAGNALREEQARGFDKKPLVIVDGRKNKSPEDMKPLGKIEFISTEVTGLQIISDIYQGIEDRSKVISGTYIEGNFVLLNRKVIATDLLELRSWLEKAPEIKPEDVIEFVNTVPYARKLERYGITASGKSKQRRVKSRDKLKRSGETVLAPNGVYFLTMRSVGRKYKHNVSLMFRFIVGSELGLTGIQTSDNLGRPLRRNYKPHKKRPKNSGPYLYPSIRLVIGSGGVK